VPFVARPRRRSLPGYGFSGEPREIGWDAGHIGVAWAELMNRLGYARYVAQGGDVGAAVTDMMSRQAPDGLLGVHTNLLVPVLGIADQLPAESDKERAALAAVAEFRESGFGYFLEMATRPQTIGYALRRSPRTARCSQSGSTSSSSPRTAGSSATTRSSSRRRDGAAFAREELRKRSAPGSRVIGYLR
jgi:hypothetical protein